MINGICNAQDTSLAELPRSSAPQGSNKGNRDKGTAVHMGEAKAPPARSRRRTTPRTSTRLYVRVHASILYIPMLGLPAPLRSRLSPGLEGSGSHGLISPKHRIADLHALALISP